MGREQKQLDLKERNFKSQWSKKQLDYWFVILFITLSNSSINMGVEQKYTLTFFPCFEIRVTYGYYSSFKLIFYIAVNM